MNRARLVAVLLFVVAAVLFLIANRAAYHGYFFEDDFSNLSFTRWADTSDFFLAAFSPKYYPNNYRPIGHLFFRTMAHAFSLKFAPYVAFLHGVHLLNVALLWLLLRRLTLPLWAASAGALYFAFHIAMFDVYWKPMYVFDLLCGTFCLLSLLFWLKDRWIVSLLCFWLAYRSKEVAVMLPLALAACEYLVGKRRWPRLIPFFAVSLWFGIQGLFTASSGQGYTFHYDPHSLAKAALYYSSRLFLIPGMWLMMIPVLLLLPFVVAPAARDRRVWFGALAFAALLVPMLLLSDRLAGAYLYVPLIGLAIALASAAPRYGAIAVGAFFALWIPWNYVNLRVLRNDALREADDRRRYVTALGEFLHTQPEIKSFVYRDAPLADPWGTLAAIEWFRPLEEIHVAREDSADARQVLESRRLAVLHWNTYAHRLEPVVCVPDTPNASYIEAGPYMPVWQLSSGWAAAQGASVIRWIRPNASARLQRPPSSTMFELVVDVDPNTKGSIAVTLDGHPLGALDLDHAGRLTGRWKVNSASAGTAEIQAQAPPFHNPDELGVRVLGFGFLPR